MPSTASWRWCVAAVLAVALVIRSVFLLQLSVSILFRQPQGDALLHFNLAREIAGGDWLGGRVFYYAPLYSYVVAVVFAIAGASVLAVAIVQVLLSTIDVWLILSIARRIFGRRVALFAGCLAAFYGPFLFYTGFLLKETVGLILLDAFVLFALGLSFRPVWWAFGLAGLMLGLVALVRPNLLPLAVPFVVWLWFERRDESRGRRTIAIGLFAGGVCAAILPVAARNYHVGGELVLISAHGGHNFFMGNRSSATGLYEPLVTGGGQSPYEEERDAKTEAERATGRPMTAAEVSRHWYARGWREIRRRPGNFLRVTGLKFALFWNDYEVPDFQDFYFVRRECPALWLAPITLGIVAPLAGVGFAATWPRWRSCLPLYLLAAGVLVSVLPFFIFARYRLPVVPVLIVFAACGVTRIEELMASRDTRHLAVPASIAAVVGLFVNWPIYRPADFLDTSYYNVGLLYHQSGRRLEAITAWREAVRLKPEYRKPWRSLGEAYFEAEQYADAADALSRSADFAGPTFSADADLVYMVAVSRLKTGEGDEAARLFELGRQRWPKDERFARSIPDTNEAPRETSPE